MNDHETHQGCILLVEDEAIIALSEKKTLEKYGYRVIIANSGEEAVETATQDTAIDLVLMDIDLGRGVDGTEAAQRILQERSLPIVFLTSHAEKEYVERVKSITNYGYVLKGSGEFVLNESITMALQLFAAHQETALKEERLSFVVSEAPVGIFQSSYDGTFRHLNREMAHILGFHSPVEAQQYYTDIATQVYASPQKHNELLQLIEKRGVVRDFRFEAVRVSGEKAYLKMNAHRLPDRGESEMLINAFVVDETKRQEAEQKLEESQKRYQSVVDLAQEIIVRHDNEGKWTFLNAAACQFFGQTREELIGQHYMDYVHPEDREPANGALRTMTDKGSRVERLVNRNWTPRGYRTVEWNSLPFTDEYGRFLGHQATGRDITGEARLREEVEHERHKWRELFEQATVGIVLADREHRIVESNPAAVEMLGYSRDELRGMSASELIHPDDLAEVSPESTIQRDYQGNGPTQLEQRYRTKDGGYVVVLVSMKRLEHLDGNISHVLMFHDITDRKQAEQESRENEKYYRLIADNIEDIVYERDLDQEFPSYVSPSVEKVLGYKPEEMRSMSLEDVLTEDSYELRRKASEDAVSNNESLPGVIELEAIHKDGHIVPLEAHSSLIRDETAAPKAVVSVVRDISERKKAEAELREERTLLQNIVDNVPGQLFVLDRKHRYITVSTDALAFMGADTTDEVIGKTVFDFFPKDLARRVYADDEKAFATEKQRSDEEWQLVDRNGSTRWVLVSKVPFADETGEVKGIIVISHDITENRKERDDLRTTVKEKGFLMQELNHRVKNNLSLVSSLISLKQSAIGNDVDLSDIRNQVKAIEKVHQSLQDSDDITHINLKSYVRDILSSVFQSSMGRDATVENNVPDISVQTAAALPLGLIINETATNALQHGFTGQEGPRFTVALEQDADDNEYVLTISNTGQPFPEDADIENPRGLGLQLVSALVSQLQGTLDLQRKPHPLFTIRFPMSLA